jgi:hypothetical protein
MLWWIQRRFRGFTTFSGLHFIPIVPIETCILYSNALNDLYSIDLRCFWVIFFFVFAVGIQMTHFVGEHNRKKDNNELFIL